MILKKSTYVYARRMSQFLVPRSPAVGNMVVGFRPIHSVIINHARGPSTVIKSNKSRNAGATRKNVVGLGTAERPQ